MVKYSITRQLIIFTFVGIVNTLLDIGLFAVLIFVFQPTEGSLLYIVLNTISFTVAATNSYFGNKYLTFASKQSANHREFSLFFAVSLIGLLINNSILGMVLGFDTIWNIPEYSIASVALLPILGKLLATGGTMISNYLGYKYLVFK